MAELTMKYRSVGLTSLADGLAHVAILRYPNSQLTTVCTEAANYQKNIDVCNKLKFAIKNNRSDRQVLGLAANQIGETEARVFVLDNHFLKIEDSEFINPVITAYIGDAVSLSEACMSFPDSVSIAIKRYETIRLEYYNNASHLFSKTFTELAAHAIQHEIDHLNGITLYQHATEKQRKKIRIAIEHARGKR